MKFVKVADHCFHHGNQAGDPGDCQQAEKRQRNHTTVFKLTKGHRHGIKHEARPHIRFHSKTKYDWKNTKPCQQCDHCIGHTDDKRGFGEGWLPKSGMTQEEARKWKYQRYIKDYLASIRSVDDNIGRVLDYLEKSGLDENTVVIYTSDQGSYLGDHGWFDKRFMYEESLKMPFLMKYPGIKNP